MKKIIVKEIESCNVCPYSRKDEYESYFCNISKRYITDHMSVPVWGCPLPNVLESDIEMDKILLNISDSDKKLIYNMCMSYRHDFGLLDKSERESLIFECSEWLRAYRNNIKNVD